MPLLPYDWQRVRERERELLDVSRAPDAIYVEDSELGWDTGKSRRNGNGMYQTSAEGIRSAVQGFKYSDQPYERRVALVGDSFTFGEEVPFEQTWGKYLQDRLDPGVQVLNFGVTSHGADQTLLKYERDVRKWRAEVTILSVLSASPLRNTSIYMFLRPGEDLPFTKPRFLEHQGTLQAVNLPPLSAEKVLATRSVRDLPLLEHDHRYFAPWWERDSLSASYLIRYLLSRFPHWPSPAEQLSEREAVSVTAQIVERIEARASESGSKLLVVSLPVRADLDGGPTRLRDALTAALGSRGIAVISLNECLLARVSIDELFMPGSSVEVPHYSPRGNAAVSECLLPEVQRALNETSSSMSRKPEAPSDPSNQRDDKAGHLSRVRR